MTLTPAVAKAQLFRSYQTEGRLLVLPNAWDAASAAIVEAAGAQAVATTSAGMAWALGRGDGQFTPQVEMTDAIARIARVVDLPVTADVEAGYGDTPEDMARTVQAVVAAGAVGVNLEDSPGTDGPLVDPVRQARQLAAAREAAAGAGLPGLFVNARTDVYLAGVGEPADRPDMVRARAEAYAEAGADMIFVPGLMDLAVIERVVKESVLPVNIMALPGAPDVKALRDVGVRRVSVGMAIAQAAYATVRRAAVELLGDGTYESVADGMGFGELNGFFTRLA